MIKTKTLFILGAGASVPFVYPTSGELRHEILFESNKYEVDIVRALNLYDDNVKDFYHSIEEFKEAFSKSGVYSIDSFLEHRPEFMKIGKTFIAKILISCEKEDNLRNAKNNWYMYLFDCLKGSFGQLDQNNISFITFNYDRSLEHFLFEAIRNQFGREPKECTEMINNFFPIIHLYGQLDPLPWQEETHGKEYSSTKNLVKRLIAAPRNIKLISDEQDVGKSENFQEAYKHIEWADRIFFLGFSFDETNLKRLNISLMKNKTIIGTTYGLAPARYNCARNYLNNKAETEIHLHNDKDALSLLQNYLEIE